MFYLFFTTPADNKRKKPGKRLAKEISRSRSVITWLLVFTWFALISFGAISALNPEWLEKAGQLGKKGSARALKNYGNNYLRQKNYYMAIAQYEQAIKIQPDNVGVLVNMAIAYARLGDPARGLRILRDALKIETAQQGDIYYNIAEILEGQNKVDEAIQYYEKAIGSNYNQDFVYRKLGPIYFASGQYDKALEAFEKLLAIQTDPLTPYLKMLQQGIKVYENEPKHLAILTDHLSQYKNAEFLADYDLQSIRDARQHDREVAKSHNHLGAIYARLGVLEKAADHFRRSLVIWPGNNDAKKNLPIVEQAIKAKEQADSSQK